MHTYTYTAPSAIFVGLWLEAEHGKELHEAGFDAAYTYFASAGFVYGSTPPRWPRMCEQAQAFEPPLGCVLTVGPGYDDEGIRPWNTRHSKSRRGGQYYDQMWSAALDAQPTSVSITSYNEWGEVWVCEHCVKAVMGAVRTGYETTQCLQKPWGVVSADLLQELKICMFMRVCA